jgi:hypothetical protein
MYFHGKIQKLFGIRRERTRITTNEPKKVGSL